MLSQTPGEGSSSWCFDPCFQDLLDLMLRFELLNLCFLHIELIDIIWISAFHRENNLSILGSADKIRFVLLKETLVYDPQRLKAHTN